MKVPTSGTSVFNAITRTGTGTNNLVVNTTVLPDLIWPLYRTAAARELYDRLRGFGQTLYSYSTDGDGANFPDYGTTQMGNTSYTQGNLDGGNYNSSGVNFIDWIFRRAPSFFDEVCYTGTGSDQNISHNLAVQPNLLIIKRRAGGTSDWNVAYQIPSFGNDNLCLNLTVAASASQTVNNGYGTCTSSTVFGVVGATTSNAVNASGSTYVAYLFATCAGVSKVGGYTGTGTTKQIDCGFTGGARFVLIKRTDSTGAWYVWDSARGIVSGNDPYLLLNSTDAEVTNTDYIDTYSAGFEISSTAPAAINASGGTFIFLAIA
jgi:hypothetical protein